MSALWRIKSADGPVGLAIGDLAQPLHHLDPHLTVAQVLADYGPGLENLDVLPRRGDVEEYRVLSPFDEQPVWAAGVTFQRSRAARLEESGNAAYYDDVFEAERPELFLKALPGRARGSFEPVRIRRDSTWDVPEPELVLVIDARGRIVGCTLGNDLSSRSIEAENPLYLPQAKIWDGSCALGPCIVPLSGLPALEEITVSLSIHRAGRRLYSDSVQMSTMKRSFSELARWLFVEQTFDHGVALMTGTSIVPTDDVTLREGDEVHISSDALGSLVNVVESTRRRLDEAVRKEEIS